MDAAGSDIAVNDRSGADGRRTTGTRAGVTQAFSVGLDRAPFTVTAT